jgi:uncharacterized protein YeeX (DUF496 family)
MQIWFKDNPEDRVDHYMMKSISISLAVYKREIYQKDKVSITEIPAYSELS